MKNHISKEHFGSLKSFIDPKSFKVRVALVIFTSVFLFSAIPYFTGSGLNSPKTIAPFANGSFPESVDNELDATYRVAFPNLTFFYPITFNMVPNQETVVLGQLNGVIYSFDNDETTTTKNVLLDLSDEVGLVSDGGFLGLTIHPDFDVPNNPKNYFYIYYTTKNGCNDDLPGFGQYTGQSCNYSDNEFQGNFLVLEKFEVDPTTMTVVTNSRTTLLRNKMYGTTHYGGGLDFGDDGFLYITTGEMGSWSRAQDITNNFAGGVLRLDVDKQGGSISHAPIRKKQTDPILNPLYDANNPSCPEFLLGEISGEEYFIPNDNPFSDNTIGSTTSLYGQPNLSTIDPSDVYVEGDFFEEYYALGLRNPFRMTKDKLTGTFYIGDVGLDSQEEIDILESGANYGWPEYEGLITGPGCDPNDELFNNMPHQEPMTAFTSSNANSITGGFVYRGSGIPELYGKYLCADYGSGDEIFSVDIDTGQYVEIATLRDVISFGEDNDGELFLLTLNASGPIYKLIDDDVNDGGSAPVLLSETGVFSDLSALEVIDGFVPYELYESFWSDGALKKRWIAVPNNDGTHSGTNEQIKYTEYGDWEFPAGTVIIKHFDLQVDDDDPSITKKIETRFSVMGSDGIMYYLTYNWNDAQTDAVLQTTGLEEPVEIATTSGGTRTQMWQFPSNSECIDCHNAANKGALGLKARYLNTDYDYSSHEINGQVGNQLVTLSHLGVLDKSITDTDTPDILANKPLQDPNATLDEKARSYLDLNCAYCHRHDNSNRADFDLRVFNSLEATELLTSGILNPLEIDPNEEIVYAGDASKSILYHRMNSVDPNIMMPPLAKTMVDQPAVDLIEAWINQLDGNSTNTPNGPNPVSNLALLTSAQLSGSVNSGRGTPLDILYDPSVEDYKVTSQFAEYGETFGTNLGTVDADNGFFWRVDWSEPKFVNYITFGGAYPNQPQQNTMWRVSYLRNGVWNTIEEGQGGWIDNNTNPDNNWDTESIYEWDGTNKAPIYAEALRLQLFSDGENNLVSIHLRGRGGNTQFSNGADLNTEPKASLMQFLPYDNLTTINTIVAGSQTACDNLDNTYSQELTVSYTNPPETGTLLVNGQTFPITTSPQTITLTGLDADGLDVEVEAEFTDGYKTYYKSSGTIFTAPQDCRNIIIGVDESMVINGDYEVASGNSIEILEGGSLTINGNLTVNGHVQLNSISNKYSSLIVTGTSTGNIFYKRHVNEYNGVTGNDLISSPLSGENFGDFATNNPNLYENPNDVSQKLFGPFNEITGNYEIYSTVTNASTNLVSGMGYRAARDTSQDALHGTTLTFYGGIETNAVAQNITTSGSSFDGWNLIGNPFSSYIDFDAFFSHNNTQLNNGAYQAIYGYDGDASNGWTVLNNLTTEQLITPGQGFFVKSKSGGGTITFTPQMRVTGSSDDFILGRGTLTNFGHLKLKASTINTAYTTDFYFNSNATQSLDPGYDAALYGSEPPNFSIYSYLVENSADTPFTIQALSDSAMNNITIALGVHANQGQEITISILETDLPDTLNVYLEDTSNNTFTLLNTGDYVFTADTNLSGSGRFYLNFEDNALSVQNPSFKDLKIISNQSNRTVEVSGQLEAETAFKLYDIHGRAIIIKQLDVTSTLQTIEVSHLSSGIYIVELKTASGNQRIQKLIIK